MIRINLLPVRADKKREAGMIQLFIGLVVIAVAVLINWQWLRTEEANLKKVQAEVATTRQKIKELEEIIGQVKDYEARKEEVQRKLDVLAELRAGKTGPVKMMDALATLIPTEVWIERFNEAGLSLTLDGRAARHEDLAAFISALNESPYFQNVQLRSATLDKGRGDRQTVRFSISGQLVYTA